MKKYLSSLLLAAMTFGVFLTGCHENKNKSDKAVANANCHDPQHHLNKSFKQMQKETKELNNQLNKEFRKQKKDGTYNICQEPQVYVNPTTPPDVATTPPDVVVVPPDVVVLPPETGPPSTGSLKRALLIGVNDYPNSPLRGCINDATDLADIARLLYQFNSSTDIKIIKNATTAEIKAGLKWLTAGLKAGDTILFWYSGHGAEYAGNDTNNQPDGLNQVICPIDFDWSPEHMITDREFNAEFSKVPAGVIFNWGADSCHSGDLTKPFPPKFVTAYKYYPGPPPPPVAAQIAKAKALGLKSKAIFPNVGFISGCKYNELSADMSDENGRFCGAMTYAFKQVIYDPNMRNKPLKEVVAAMNKIIDEMQLDQNPQCEGPDAQTKRPFLRK